MSASWRWVILAVFCFEAALFASLFLNFATTPSLTSTIFELNNDPEPLQWISTTGLLSIVAFTPVASWGLQRYHFLFSVASFVLIVLCAWVRYAAARTGNYPLVICSGFFGGAAGAVVIANYSSIPQQWFAPKERALATSLALYSNYASWALSALLVPMKVKKNGQMDSFLLWQAILASAGLLLFTLIFRPQTTTTPQATSSTTIVESPLTARQSFSSLARNGQYWLHSSCYAVFAGIGLSLTFVQQNVMGPTCADKSGGGIGLSNDQTAWTNFAFIGCGVLAGLVVGGLGGIASDTHVGIILRSLFVVGTAALVTLEILSRPGVFVTFHKDTLFALLMGAMVLAGIATLGFQGLGLRVAVTMGAPVSPAYTGGLVMMLIQGLGATYSQVTTCQTRFMVHAGSAVIVSLALLVVARFRPRIDKGETLLDLEP
mmetsp:Transcript_8667/g.21397  ORF Transcript_8667/g.21397 Transcript_8667/m.21397 type:complete len:432 (+) Transcript_8667:204-1499(+)